MMLENFDPFVEIFISAVAVLLVSAVVTGGGWLIGHPELGLIPALFMAVPAFAGVLVAFSVVGTLMADWWRGLRRWRGTPLDGLLFPEDKKAIAVALRQAFATYGSYPTVEWRSSAKRHGAVCITGTGSVSCGGAERKDVSWTITATVGDTRVAIHEKRRWMASVGRLFC